ncbi:MAG TPA: NUDIX domain-containing protein [Nocardioidaceae bacterium]|nr:NUDIX domain-containing protein [Nocardioidaceae bacterium]
MTTPSSLSATLHADALRTLEQWSARSAEQETLRTRYVAHLRAHPDGVSRSCRPDHLTAGCLVVSGGDMAGRAVLLNLHRKARRWFAFGGHCEAGDATLADAALREATEESGLSGLAFDPAPVHLDEHVVTFCHPGEEVHHLDVRFRAFAPAGAVPAVSDESLDVRWWPVDALPSDLGEEMHALIRAACA